jgi:hypothetical protein
MHVAMIRRAVPMPDGTRRFVHEEMETRWRDGGTSRAEADACKKRLEQSVGGTFRVREEEA